MTRAAYDTVAESYADLVSPDELEATCEQPVLTLEVNLDPPNEPSLAFHARRGFVEVGQRDSGGHLVSLMAKPLA